MKAKKGSFCKAVISTNKIWNVEKIMQMEKKKKE